ncbi:aspartyl-phosphate phosphatase Spo0E family protein [Aneurinibacillus terranovensis]|uniref:aspartyl-phosphate phosphatase Spo0E family protein n=1 Tax=Aneurinibacillus terranovensis TaxID=278991 RepID=UPI000426233A|nr:aspartyl-phosphate phosphatase Spo0E family protein [Aneurinibacillus terranovensis]
MGEKDETLKIIEGLRRKLNKLARERPLTDPQIILVSQKLDTLLNEYYKRQKNT